MPTAMPKATPVKLFSRRNFRQAVFLEPQAPEAHFFLSLALQKLGDTKTAARHRLRAEHLSADATSDTLLPVQQTRLALRTG